MRLTRIVAVACGIALAGPLSAQTHYPAKPVRVLVGYAAGSSTDIVGRVMADRLSVYWKQNVYVENRGGAAGNLANAFLYGSPHVSVGASTAIFGAVGMLGGLGVVRRSRISTAKRRAWIPIAAALGLLAMLGTGGPRVDVLAHFFGFLFGGVLGILSAFIFSRLPGPKVQWFFGCVALATLIYCWILALR